jgi:hypothetical protein
VVVGALLLPQQTVMVLTAYQIQFLGLLSHTQAAVVVL